MNITNDIFVSITHAIGNSNSSINIADTLIDAVPDGFVDSIMTYRIIFNSIYTIYDYNRADSNTDIFKSCKTNIMFCIVKYAPIPIALAADDEGRGKAIQYFLFAASVGLEAVIIYLATNIYSVGLAGLSSTVGSTNAISTIVAMLFLNGMYLAVIQYASQFAEKLTGGH